MVTCFEFEMSKSSNLQLDVPIAIKRTSKSSEIRIKNISDVIFSQCHNNHYSRKKDTKVLMKTLLTVLNCKTFKKKNFEAQSIRGLNSDASPSALSEIATYYVSM